MDLNPASVLPAEDKRILIENAKKNSKIVGPKNFGDPIISNGIAKNITWIAESHQIAIDIDKSKCTKFLDIHSNSVGSTFSHGLNGNDYGLHKIS